jgi:iron complex transport system substrate-binding protein
LYHLNKEGQKHPTARIFGMIQEILIILTITGEEMFRKITFTLLCLGLLLTACASPAASPTPVATATDLPATQAATIPPTLEPTATPIRLTDGLGRTVELAGPAQRIVSLTPATTEILFAIGAGSRLVGRDLFSDYPAEAQAVQDIGGSWGEYDTEGIISLQPDLVLAGGINPPELVASLEGHGLTVYFLPNPTTLDELYTNLQTLGSLTGNQTEADSLVTSLDARAKQVDAQLAGITERPMVYYELDVTPYTAGPGTFVDLLIARAGGVNFGAQMDSAWAQISLEQLVVADPALILLGDSAYGESPATVAARPGWNVLSAVKNGQVFPFDDNLVSRPGPRLVDGLEALARLIHPEVFK